ncbi:hypothetical protein MTO98_07515 [Mucilaginibacter sp. SMC90]|uniref:hypothetical protein n=1 Tax=Mucilaginibacter sp. SMC90 TaxID=2929803 RepID=UPI001FB1BD93|nr:hypothetical protein [Mucilaginibacter sp. SMC90]UOE50924.1 hypothetical protein MTO98_07515 [Mucilaginibacter sp. SMC90]
MKNNELLGTLALVNPELEHDPGGRKGNIGIITYVDSLENQVYLSFEAGGEGRYPAAELMRLKDRDRFFPDLMKNASNLDLNDFKALFKISNLQDMGRGQDQWQALEIARDNPGVWEGSLESLSESISYIKASMIGR